MEKDKRPLQYILMAGSFIMKCLPWDSLKPYLQKGLLILILVAGLFYNWLPYFYHLMKHQTNIFLNKISINSESFEQLIAHDLTVEQSKNLQLIERTREKGKKLYQLEKSTNYTRYIDLNREALGWNLVVAFPLKMELVEFTFPPIGKFTYLGFFNADLLKKEIKHYRSQGYEVGVYTIAAYSSLGYLEDPVFSTYLDFDAAFLENLILHEMAHERLYFASNSNFSEAMASFIAKKAQRYTGSSNPDPHERVEEQGSQIIKSDKEETIFYDKLNQLKIELEALYKSNKGTQTKLHNKNLLITRFQKWAKTRNFSFLSPQSGFLQPGGINNAVLLQTHRYSPNWKSFEALFTQCSAISETPFKCWFDHLEKLKNCPDGSAEKFLKSEGKIETITRICSTRE